ncbi:hypothetical protein SmJEL517_g05078 [Synchytrium microbalum]|uniref:GOLD domain-containing protein n=1 Tax=Synchytrium microbalum TaxID=1806994 RepID=A0A507C291_9FUNG|nr:uncharacterized protein SmJEL517_g05078 [Synchytrium microbalum]TPX31655.1 hypothetical protein SmJEL517_g05078 [Synchytrium microbalum]
MAVGHNHSIKSLLLSLVVISLYVSRTTATTLTYRMQPHERACFYGAAKAIGEKIAFYFAVQSGGSFDIDYEILDPQNLPVLNGDRERQGDYVFAASKVGEYTFCFSNTMSTFAEKLVDFDISVEHELNEGGALKPPKPNVDKETSMDESLRKIGDSLYAVQRQQKFFRTRENRNFDTVKSTEGRIFWFALIQGGMIMLMAVLQVYVVRNFFRNPKGPRI